ncbi:metal ABC transporter substrate-binding protein [Clostridium carnis]
MKKLTYALVMVTAILFLGLGTISSPLLANTTNEFDEEKDTFLNIVTVNKVQYYMVKSIVGERHNVEYLVKNEEEIKKFKYNENVISNISNMDLFIYTGFGYEPWVNNLIDKLQKGNVGIINMGRGIRPLSYEINKEGKENPYYSLGMNEYKVALYNIKSAIQDKDIKNRELYEKNYNEIINNMDTLSKEIKSNINKFKDITVLTDTDVFDYLLKDYGVSTIKISNEEELLKLIQDKKINLDKAIFIKNSSENKENEKTIEFKGLIIQMKNYDEDISFDKLMFKNINLLLEALNKLYKQ